MPKLNKNKLSNDNIIKSWKLSLSIRCQLYLPKIGKDNPRLLEQHNHDFCEIEIVTQEDYGQ